jgi:ATP-dependent RNA helicase DeaD
MINEAFEALGLNEPLVQALADLGYEAPTPIQSLTIPALLAGRDLIGQAQTGTGKTAAFVLPLLQGLDISRPVVQALVLTPTRELALQVAEACHSYAKHLGRVHVLPVYGGQPIYRQIEHLRRGVHVVVGTPGRIMDHLRRGTLEFAALRWVILDEADEMLRMGFIEDVDWILAQVGEAHQTALFSATLPPEIRRIAQRYLKDPVVAEIEHKALTVPTVAQFYTNVTEQGKLDALTRVLETEASTAVLIFTRTKTGAAELGEKLQAHGYAAEALHGDLNQAQREQVVRRLRAGQTEIVIATDVAARGLDVEQISHVINYDIPYDAESYVHRIGRTARAGRTGRAILFVTPRQQRMLREIEHYTGKRILPMQVPSLADVAARRTALFKERIRKVLTEEDIEPYLALVEELAGEGYEMAEVAAAAARLARGDQPPDVAVAPQSAPESDIEPGMVRLFINAGRSTGVRPSDIVGAIANETDIPGKAIGAIDIYDHFAFVEVPEQYKDQILARMARSKLRNRPVSIRVAWPEQGEPRPRPRPARKDKRRAS